MKQSLDARDNQNAIATVQRILSIADLESRHYLEAWHLLRDIRPSAPSSGQARANILTPGGLHFGQGPYSALSKDFIGGPIIRLAFQLMQQLIKLSRSPSSTIFPAFSAS